MKKMTKQILAFAMVAAIAVTSVVVTPSLSKSAKKPALSKKKLTMVAGKTKKIRVKNSDAKAKIKWKTSNKSVVKFTKKVSKGKKAYAKIKGVSKGKAWVKAIYKVGSIKKTLKCRVTVKPKQVSTATQTAIVVTAEVIETIKPTVKPTATPTVKPTATPVPTATVTPKKTVKPTATPKYTMPSVTAPPTQYIEFSANNKFILNENGDASLSYNSDGSCTIVFNKQYAAVNFYLPDNAANFFSKYTSVTIEYDLSGYNLGHALFDDQTNFGENWGENETGKHPNWNKEVTTGNNISKTFSVTDECHGGCLRGLQIFNPNETGQVSTIRVKRVIFRR